MKSKTTITLSRENLKEILGEAVRSIVPGMQLEKFAVHATGGVTCTLTPHNAELPLDDLPVNKRLEEDEEPAGVERPQ